MPPDALFAETPLTTSAGHAFVAPRGWTVERRGEATILGAPEADSTLALVDVRAADADAAVAAAWQALRGAPPPWGLLRSSDQHDGDGWSKLKYYVYDTPLTSNRTMEASARYASGGWLVIIADFDVAVADKRSSEIDVIGSTLIAKGYKRESFAGKQAHDLDDARLASIAKFVTEAEHATGVPGVGYGIIQHGKVVFAGGIGVRELGKPATIDANTEFMIASNTKQLTTLLLAKLVDDRRLTWDARVKQLLPSFKLGSGDVTGQVEIKHLVCACTGLPRQDLEFVLTFKDLTPEKTMQLLGTVRPTSKFGETYQYSNLMAAAGGFVGGHVMFPKLELGAAFDRAMQMLVFDPLGMTETTFDYAHALNGNHAMPHHLDVDGKLSSGPIDMAYAFVPVRPAGGAWSTVNDMLKYVAMELARGKLPDGTRYIAEKPLRAREAPQVAMSKIASYGMGLIVDTTYGVTLVHHGGDVYGYHSDVMWLPDHDVGAVILTNGDGGQAIRDDFRRKLLEVVFDGYPIADQAIAEDAAERFASIAAGRKRLAIPADPAAVAQLATTYTNAALGTITVTRKYGRTWFQIGALESEMASKTNGDGSISFVPLVPGFSWFEVFVSGDNLVVGDPQHVYVFTPQVASINDDDDDDADEEALHHVPTQVAGPPPKAVPVADRLPVADWSDACSHHHEVDSSADHSVASYHDASAHHSAERYLGHWCAALTSSPDRSSVNTGLLIWSAAVQSAQAPPSGSSGVADSRGNRRHAMESAPADPAAGGNVDRLDASSPQACRDGGSGAPAAVAARTAA